MIRHFVAKKAADAATQHCWYCRTAQTHRLVAMAVPIYSTFLARFWRHSCESTGRHHLHDGGVGYEVTIVPDGFLSLGVQRFKQGGNSAQLWQEK